MNKQPEALRLADHVSANCLGEDIAVELRRLHFAHEHQYAVAGEMLRQAERAHQLNAELLAVLTEAVDDLERWASYTSEYFQKKQRRACARRLADTIAYYRTAIAKAEEVK